MAINIKTCFYEQKRKIFDKGCFKNLSLLGFESKLVEGEVQKLFEYLSQNEVEILVVNVEDVDKERLGFVLSIIYNNFCDQILVVSTELVDFGDCYKYLILDDLTNFDLKVGLTLLNIKKEIEKVPSKNIRFIKNKVCELLDLFMFPGNLDGFKYYLEAISRAYLKYPFKYPMLDLYKEIAEKFNKTPCAVEKSMRVALNHAFNKVKDAPTTEHNIRIKQCFTCEMNNSTTVSLLLSRLLVDKELNPQKEVNMG